MSKELCSSEVVGGEGMEGGGGGGLRGCGGNGGGSTQTVGACTG